MLAPTTLSMNIDDSSLRKEQNMLESLKSHLLTFVAIGMWLAVSSASFVHAYTFADEGDAWVWFEGHWEVAYDDAELGEVRGSAFIGSGEPQRSDDGHGAGILFPGVRGVEIVFEHPHTGVLYHTSGTATYRNGRLDIHVANHFPISASQESPYAEAQVLHVAPGTSVTAKLDDHSQQVEVVARGARGNLTIRFDLAEEGGDDAGDSSASFELIEGEWRYHARNREEMGRSRAGDFDESAMRVTGVEQWTRPPIEIAVIAALGEFQPAAWRAHHANPDLFPQPEFDPSLTPLRTLQHEHGSDVIGVLWLSIGGAGMPVQPKRLRELSIDDDDIIPTGRYRINPRYPHALDVEVALRDTLERGPKTVVLNGVEGQWEVELQSDRIVSVHFLRAPTLELTGEVRHGDVFYIEALYEPPSYADLQMFALRTAGDERIEVPLMRDEGHPMLYRSPRILVIDKNEVAPLPSTIDAHEEIASDRFAPVIVRAAGGTVLRAVPEDGSANQGGAISATLVVNAGPPDSLWEQAMERARACRRAGDDSPDEFTNYVLHNVLLPRSSVMQSVSVSIEDHAAAILLRDELVLVLEEFLDAYAVGSPVDHSAPADEVKRQLTLWDAALRAEAESLIDLASAGGSHPLFHFTVASPDTSWDVLLSTALHKYPHEKAMIQRRGEWNDFVEYAVGAISAARGELNDYTYRSLGRARAVSDCEVRELLKLTGIGTSAIAERLVPKLVRPAEASEPAYPRWVPDVRARSRVASLSTLAENLAAQEELSRLDTDLIMIAATFGTMGAALRVGTLIKSAAQVGNAPLHLTRTAHAITGTMYGLVALDAYRVGLEAMDYTEAVRDRSFGRGIIGVAGDERFQAADQEARDRGFGLLMAAGMTVGTSAGFELHRIGVDNGVRTGRVVPSQELADAALRQARTRSWNELPVDTRNIVEGQIVLAQHRASEVGMGGLTQTERQTLEFAESLRQSNSGPPTVRSAPPVAEPPVPPRTVFSDADRASVTNYFKNTLNMEEGAVASRVNFWQQNGFDADAVIAGHHYVHGRSISDLPMDAEKFRPALKRFLARTDHGTPSSLESIIDSYMGGGLGSYQPAPLPVRSGPGGRPSPDLPGSRTATLPPQDRPSSQSATSVRTQPQFNSVLAESLPDLQFPNARPGDLGTMPLSVDGIPGPGIEARHLIELQRVADATGTPLVVFGPRQTGVKHRPGQPFNHDADLHIGVIGDTAAQRRVIIADVGQRVPNAAGIPQFKFPNEAAALEHGFLVVRPRGVDLSAVPAMPPPRRPTPPARESYYANPLAPNTVLANHRGRFRVADGEPLNPSGRGLFADLRGVTTDGGKPLPLVAKVYGTRGSGPEGRPELNLQQSRQMVDETVYGDQVIQNYNRTAPPDEQIPTPEIILADRNHNPPIVISRRLQENLPPGVEREIIGADAAIYARDANGNRIQRTSFDGAVMYQLRPEAQNAVIELMRRLIRAGIVWEDKHLNNIFFQVRRVNGREQWTAGILDQDRLVTWNDWVTANPRARFVRNLTEEMVEAPGFRGVYSIKAGTPITRPNEMVYKLMEYKNYIRFNQQTGQFESGYLDIERVLEAFSDLPDFVSYQRRGSMLLPSVEEVPPLLRLRFTPHWMLRRAA